MAKKALVLSASDVDTSSPAPEPAAATPAAPTASPAAPKKAGAGEPLNFRVDPEFGMRFRMYAVSRKMRLQDLLVRSFEALEKQG